MTEKDRQKLIDFYAKCTIMCDTTKDFMINYLLKY